MKTLITKTIIVSLIIIVFIFMKSISLDASVRQCSTWSTEVWYQGYCDGGCESNGGCMSSTEGVCICQVGNMCNCDRNIMCENLTMFSAIMHGDFNPWQCF